MTTINVAAQPVGDWILAWEGWLHGWEYGHDAAEGTWGADPLHCTCGNSGLAYYTDYTIYRSLFKVDLTSIPPSAIVKGAVLSTYHCWAYAEDCKIGCGKCGDMTVVLVDGTGVPQTNAGYGVMLGRTTSCGSIIIPNGTYTVDEDYIFTLNPAGLAIIQANLGGWAYFGIRIYSDIISDPQCGYHWWTFNYDGDGEMDVDYIVAAVGGNPNVAKLVAGRLA